MVSRRALRVLTCTASTALAVSLLPAAAYAAAPQRVPLEATSYTFPAGLYCDFEVTFTETVQRGVLTFFQDGTLIVTGDYAGVLTNDSNGHTYAVKAPGPWHVGDAFTVLGPQLFFMNADEFLPGIYLYDGKVVVQRDENGLISNLETAGTRSGNLCDELV